MNEPIIVVCPMCGRSHKRTLWTVIGTLCAACRQLWA